MDTETAYNQALDYLYSFVDYSLKHSSELAKADFKLDRMFALMELLGNPQSKYPIIHVAGTKGKGSTSALCAAALQAAGYSVGLYTSPHLLDYVERIQINGAPISHEQLIELVEEIKPYVAKIEMLTTFEITTALAFLAFGKYGVNAAVFEVGLGGRLDATNIVAPKVSVITSLSYDHTAVLGNTLTLIAGEKAGIIKDGVPVVSSPQKDESLVVLERVAALKNSSLTLIGRDVNFELIESSLDGQKFIIHHSSFITPLLGNHQVENAATAYAALMVTHTVGRADCVASSIAPRFMGSSRVSQLRVPSGLTSTHSPSRTRAAASAIAGRHWASSLRSTRTCPLARMCAP